MQHRKKSATTGETLIEVLVALVIFSIAFLGLTLLQLTNLKLQRESQFHATAAILAADMADRMRTNHKLAMQGTSSVFNNPAGSQAPNPSCLGLSGGGGFSNTSCTPSQMALHDFFEWYSLIQGSAATAWYPQVNALLPSGNGVTCIDSTPNDPNSTFAAPGCDGVIVNATSPVYAVKLFWVERSDASGNATETPHQYSAAVEP